MKTTKILKAIFAGFFFMGVWTCSQAKEPAISKIYTNEQIEQMLVSFRNSTSNDVTPTVSLQQKLLADFPKAKDIDWETVANVYEAEFEISFTDYKAFYDTEGNLLMYSIDISRSQIPQIIKDAIHVKFPKYRIEDADKIVQGTETLYKVELEQGQIETNALFKANGTFIK